MTHPLDPLTPDEIAAAVAAVRSHGRLGDGAWFSTVTIDDARRPGVSGRRARVVAVPRPKAAVVEATVDLGTGEVAGWVDHDGVRPALGFGESLVTILAVTSTRPSWPPWRPAASTTCPRCRSTRGRPATSATRPRKGGGSPAACRTCGRRADRQRIRPTDRGRPGLVDMATGEVLEVEDHGVVPMPTDPGRYYPEDHPPGAGLALAGDHPARGAGLHRRRPPDRWQSWSPAVSLDPLEGLVLHHVAWTAAPLRPPPGVDLRDGRALRRPRPAHGWKNAFDVGEWGLGRLANSLELGCDCLGEIRYLDAVLAGENGERQHHRQRHLPPRGGRGHPLEAPRPDRRPRRGAPPRRLVSLDLHRRQLRVRLLLVPVPGRLASSSRSSSPASCPPPGGERPRRQTRPRRWSRRASPRRSTSTCSAPGSTSTVDGPVNEVEEVDVVPLPPGDGNPWANGFAPWPPCSSLEQAAQRVADPARSRTWRIVNPACGTAWASRSPTSSSRRGHAHAAGGPTRRGMRRRPSPRHNLWVTPYAPRRAPGRRRLPEPARRRRRPALDRRRPPLADTDVVLWHSFGLTHVPRPRTGRSCRSSRRASCSPHRLLRPQPRARQQNKNGKYLDINKLLVVGITGAVDDETPIGTVIRPARIGHATGREHAPAPRPRQAHGALWTPDVITPASGSPPCGTRASWRSTSRPPRSPRPAKIVASPGPWSGPSATGPPTAASTRRCSTSPAPTAAPTPPRWPAISSATPATSAWFAWARRRPPGRPPRRVEPLHTVGYLPAGKASDPPGGGLRRRALPGDRAAVRRTVRPGVRAWVTCCSTMSSDVPSERRRASSP